MNGGELVPMPHRTDWRLTQADAVDQKVIAIGDAIRFLDDVHAAAETDGDIVCATEIRSLMARLRIRAADLVDQARALRSAARDEPHPLTDRARTWR